MKHFQENSLILPGLSRMCNIIWFLECGHWQAIKYIWFLQINFNHIKPFPFRRMPVIDAREEASAIKLSWWRHQMETFSASLPICVGNSRVTGEFSSQMQKTRSFDVFFDLRLNKRLSKQTWGWWFGCLRAHYDVTVIMIVRVLCKQNWIVWLFWHHP